MRGRPFTRIIREGQDRVKIGQIELLGQVMPGLKTRVYVKKCKCGKKYEASSRNHHLCPLCFGDWKYKKENEDEMS